MADIQLNPEQKRAVDHIYGPLLVLAGPGTGKTQLLSSRIANILKKTDVHASNILCLTFTESAAQNMRERLRTLIGEAAYDITISTYHSFGSDIIRNNAEHFQQINFERSDDIRLETPVDELTQVQIIGEIIDQLPYDSPLAGARYYVKSVVGTISDLKQHLITPERLEEIAKLNLSQILEAQRLIDEIINNTGGISKKSKEKILQYAGLLEGLQQLRGDLVRMASGELLAAHEKASELESPTPLRQWKDAWLHKDENDYYTLTDPLRSERMIELAHVYKKYESELHKRAAYDFDDMILRAIDGLRNNDELRFNLLERYQFILLDEFQDTNPSQFELVKHIANHPIHEGKPNIMAVGDDDQAIFAFQGAHVGNMKDFVGAFKEVEIINLVKNYRSHSDVLHLAANIADQIEDRLHKSLPSISKVLESDRQDLPAKVQVCRQEFLSEASENAWIAQQIETLIKGGTSASEIAVLSPKHKILEGLVPFLKQQNVPIAYEKRENILETEIVRGLRINAQLLDALARRDIKRTDEFFPLVLNLPYWQLPAEDIWSVNWRLDKAYEDRSWAEIALQSKTLTDPVRFYLSLSASAATEPLELTLDKLIGSAAIRINGREAHSPLKSYYFGTKKRIGDPLKYYEAISHLSVIRSRLRDYQSSSDKALNLQDFLNFFVMYESADTPLINSHAIAQHEDSVQLMTAYKSKGLEFENVFLMQAHDDVWGSTSRGNTNKLALPANLRHIRYVSSSDDERKRLLFVAITRAKHNVFITSHLAKDTGKSTVPLKYLAERDGRSAYLPPHNQQIIRHKTSLTALAKNTELLWQAGQISLPANFRSLLTDRLAKYQMSPTHLNTFTDIERGGPEVFLVQTLLRFPQAPEASGEFGTAIHHTLEWYQNRINAIGYVPKMSEVLSYYDKQLDKRYLSEIDRLQLRQKGRKALENYLKMRQVMFKTKAKAEVNFQTEGVVLNGARLSGKIDRLEIDSQAKTVKVVDYKTGKPLLRWGNDMKSIKYRQQLYFYKLLLEKSISWRNYKVVEARLEFVESGSLKDFAAIKPPLKIDFDTGEYTEFKKLIHIVWDKIQKLDLPDINKYSRDAKGTKAFVNDLFDSLEN